MDYDHAKCRFTTHNIPIEKDTQTDRRGNDISQYVDRVFVLK